MWLLLSSSLFAGTPTAEAGLPILAYVGDTVVLNGSASTDPDNLPLNYAWTATSGPDVEIQDDTGVSPTIHITDPGTYRFSLTVNNGIEDSAPDEVDVVVPYEEIDIGKTGCTHVPAGSAGLWGLGLLALWRRRR